VTAFVSEKHYWISENITEVVFEVVSEKRSHKKSHSTIAKWD